MRLLLSLSSALLLAACTASSPVPQTIQNKVAEIPAEDLPRQSHSQQPACNKPRYQAYDKHADCKIAARRDVAARQMMRDTPSINKELKNDTTKN